MMRVKFEEYRRWLQQERLADHSRRAYLSHVNAFVGFTAGSSQPFSEVQRYITHLIGESARSATINAKLTAINHFAKFCGANDIQVNRNVIATTDAVGVPVLSRTEEIRLLEVVENCTIIRDKAIFLLLFYAGVRPGECCSANISTINLSEGTATLSSSKTGKSRIVDLHPALRSVLAQWLLERRALAVVNGATHGGGIEGDLLAETDDVFFGHWLHKFVETDAPLFLTNANRRISASVVDNIVRKFGLQARMVISARTIRNTFLRNLAVSGTTARMVASIGGHRRPGLVKRYFNLPLIASSRESNLVGGENRFSMVSEPLGLES